MIHSPLAFSEDMSDNPNRRLGALKIIADDALFIRDTWNNTFCVKMTPHEGDIVMAARCGMNVFVESNLETLLTQHNITTVVLAGFLSNCCVESTMRTAYEKGYNVITLTDCCSAMSTEAHNAATEGSYRFFSSPVTKEEFKSLFE